MSFLDPLNGEPVDEDLDRVSLDNLNVSGDGAHIQQLRRSGDAVEVTVRRTASAGQNFEQPTFNGFDRPETSRGARSPQRQPRPPMEV